MKIFSGVLTLLVALAATNGARAGCPNDPAQGLRAGFDGSGNACVTDAFAPNGNYATPLAVSATSSETALPAGSVVLVSNTGSAIAYINLGPSSAVTATTSAIPMAGGTQIRLAVGSNTNLAAVTATGSTTLNLAGGSGG